jgi:hypothetical protein
MSHKLNLVKQNYTVNNVGLTSTVSQKDCVQKRAYCFILSENPCNSTMIYKGRLLRLKLLPMSYWHEIKDMMFMHSCRLGKS